MFDKLFKGKPTEMKRNCLLLAHEVLVRIGGQMKNDTLNWNSWKTNFNFN